MKVLRESEYTYLHANYKRNKNRGLILLLVGIPTFLLGVGLAILVTDVAMVVWPLVAVGLALGVWGGRELASSLSYKAGIEGEQAVVQALQELDDSYCLINDIMVGGRRRNIDHILLSAKGIFVIETKNYTGDMRCDGDRWSKKVGRRLYQMKSVSRQARYNASYINNVIRKKVNLGIAVTPICVFTSPWVELKLRRLTMPILRLEDLAGFVQQAAATSIITEAEIQKIAECILETDQ